MYKELEGKQNFGRGGGQGGMGKRSYDNQGSQRGGRGGKFYSAGQGEGMRHERYNNQGGQQDGFQKGQFKQPVHNQRRERDEDIVDPLVRA